MSDVKPNRKRSIALVAISMLFGFVALLASVGGLSHVIAESGYSSTTGVISSVDVIENVSYKPRTKNRCSPIVEFQAGGETYTSGPDQYSVYGKGSECRYRTGDEITVRYDPSDPTKSSVSNSSFDWTLGLVGGALALFLGVIAPLRIILKSRAKAHITN